MQGPQLPKQTSPTNLREPWPLFMIFVADNSRTWFITDIDCNWFFWYVCCWLFFFQAAESLELYPVIWALGTVYTFHLHAAFRSSPSCLDPAYLGSASQVEITRAQARCMCFKLCMQFSEDGPPSELNSCESSHCFQSNILFLTIGTQQKGSAGEVWDHLAKVVWLQLK